MKHVSIIVLNLNGKRFLKECLESVLAQTYKSFDIILVDNASTDDSLAFVREQFQAEITRRRISIIANTRNTGFCEGNNIGVRAAKGELVVLLNNDVRVDKGWLQGLVHALATPDTLVAGSLSWDRRGKEACAKFYKDKKTTINLCGELISVPRTHSGPVVDAFYVGGVSLIFDKKQIPLPFANDYFAYAEDLYLGWLVQLKGKRVVLTKQSTLFHYAGGTKHAEKKLNKLAAFHGTKNQIINYFVFYEWKNILRILPLFLLTQTAHVLYEPKKFWLKCKAIGWSILHWRSIRSIRKEVQRQRKLPDKKILARMSGKFFDTEFMDNPSLMPFIRFMNALFLAYCAIVGIRTVERTSPQRRGKIRASAPSRGRG